MIRRALVLAVMLSLVHCGFAKGDSEAVPESPLYARDVLPVLGNHCLLCHSVPSNFGAPKYFRLDSLEDAGGLAGAATMAPLMLERTHNDTMPPAASWGDGLGPHDKEIISKWVQQGAH